MATRYECKIEGMKSVLFILAVLIPGYVFSQTPYPFQEFAVDEKFKGEPATPLLDNPTARRYRTTIREAAKRGSNFAGHYTIAMWGCGTECIEIAIVNEKTGKVYAPPHLSGGVTEPYFRIDSRLLVTEEGSSVHGPRKTNFFEWDGTKLKLVRSFPAQQQ